MNVSVNEQAIASALDRLAVPLALAEVHGLKCGLLCSLSSAAAKTRWFTELLDAASLEPASVAAKSAELKALDEWSLHTQSSLNDADMEFAPAVPDDEVPVGDRLKALADFCGGFTYGIGIALARRGQKPLPADTREIIEDFQAIEAADPEDTDEGEAPATPAEQEDVYIELLEYVRVGVLLVLEEMRPISSDQPVTHQ